jgi:hypothetical protein
MPGTLPASGTTVPPTAPPPMSVQHSVPPGYTATMGTISSAGMAGAYVPNPLFPPTYVQPTTGMFPPGSMPAYSAYSSVGMGGIPAHSTHYAPPYSGTMPAGSMPYGYMPPPPPTHGYHTTHIHPAQPPPPVP